MRDNVLRTDVIQTTNIYCCTKSKRKLSNAETIGLVLYAGLVAYEFVYKPVTASVKLEKERDEKIDKLIEYIEAKEAELTKQNNEIKDKN